MRPGQHSMLHMSSTNDPIRQTVCSPVLWVLAILKVELGHSNDSAKWMEYLLHTPFVN